MKIPWYIYVPLSLTVTIVTFSLCVKEPDITTPPTPQEIRRSVEEWKAGLPISEETLREAGYYAAPQDHDHSADTSANTLKQPAAEPNTTTAQPATSTPVAPAPAFTSPFFSSPPEKTQQAIPLDFLVDKNFTTAQLNDYARQMMAQNHPRRARLAYERVIDSASDATDEDKKAAAAAITSLTPQTPHWQQGTRTESNLPILPIELTLDSTYQDLAERITSTLKFSVLLASDGHVGAEVTLNFKEPTANTGANTSDASYSSLHITNTQDPASNNPLVTFTITQASDLDTKIPAALYYAVKSKHDQIQKLVSEKKLTSIPKLPTHIPPQQALRTYITRLAWTQTATLSSTTTAE